MEVEQNQSLGGALIGLAACMVSSFSFGSMFVPVRKYPAGDGVFVQWCTCSAVYFVGLVTYFGSGFPPFQPLAMLGGALWATGNLTSIPIINRIGIGAGQLIWGVAVCVVGWANGRFGIIGVKATIPSSPILNYLGVILVIVGGVLLSMVEKTTDSVTTSVDNEEETLGDGISPLPADGTVSSSPGGCDGDLENGRSSMVGRNEEETSLTRAADGELVAIASASAAAVGERDRGEGRRASNKSKQLKDRALAIGMALFAGTCYGLMFTPVSYMQDNPEKFTPTPPKDAILYVHSHFTGIWLVSTVALVVYAALKGNRPMVNPQLVLPALFSGTLWAVGMLSWFPANDYLSQATTFPINAMLPGCIAACWSVFYFREIRGAKNLKLLSVAIGVTVAGVSLVAISKMI